MANDDLCYLTLAEAARALRQKRCSPVELTDACLERIGRYDAKLHSFITLTTYLALAQAKEA